MQETILSSEYLTLGQILKESGVISTGRQAKYFSSEQDILVNGEAEKRRGQKIYANTVITLFDKQKIYIKRSGFDRIK
ncbi:MAG: RNA-binding S4 domain-containing protein [Streptococcaceae bacterium]|jgi:ribosome-associated protein YbcJ (S4-like RNA binding protein)|nr:RNA-binding S4 domain-containing protein [Streptococcaceae bacterium]